MKPGRRHQTEQLRELPANMCMLKSEEERSKSPSGYNPQSTLTKGNKEEQTYQSLLPGARLGRNAGSWPAH